MFFVLVFLVILVLSPVGRAIADRLSAGTGRPDDLVVQRLTSLEAEVERLAGEVKRLEEEGEFVHRLIANWDDRAALGSGE